MLADKPLRLIKSLLVGVLLLCPTFVFAGEPTTEHSATPDVPIKTIQSFDPANCYSYTEWRLDKELPPMATIRPNTFAQVGAVAVMYYPSSGLRHFGVVEFVGDGFILISEANYKKGTFGFRIVMHSDTALQGFWNPVS